MNTLSNFDFTCKRCNKLETIEFGVSDFRNVFDNNQDISEMSNAETAIYLATFSLHEGCFAEILEEYKDKIKPGFYVSQNTYDDDEGREVPVFSYIHKANGDKFEIWNINTSSRYVRKGGEFLTKSAVSFEMAVLHLSYRENKSSDEPIEKLQEVLETYSKTVRKEFLQNIVEATTEALIEYPFATYDENTLIDDYRAFLDDCDVLEENLSGAKRFMP